MKYRRRRVRWLVFVEYGHKDGTQWSHEEVVLTQARARRVMAAYKHHRQMIRQGYRLKRSSVMKYVLA